MNFCTNCGAEINGPFCTKCGAAAGSPAQAAPPQAAPPQAPMYAPAAPAPAKGGSKVLFWILGIIGAIVLLIVVGVAVVGFYIKHKVEQAGVSSELLQRNPGLAVLKIMTATNPNLEILSTDENDRVVKIRDKQTGKIMTMTFDDLEKGKITFRADDDKGGATLSIGQGVTGLPDWAPAYPGARESGGSKVDAHGDNGEAGGTVTFATSDPPEKVLAFYTEKLKAAGLTVNGTFTSGTTSTLSAADDSDGRGVHVAISGAGDGSTITVIYGQKKK